MSAHADDLPDDDLRGAGITAVVNKPFRLAELEATARGSAAGDRA